MSGQRGASAERVLCRAFPHATRLAPGAPAPVRSSSQPSLRALLFSPALLYCHTVDVGWVIVASRRAGAGAVVTMLLVPWPLSCNGCLGACLIG